MVEMFVEARKNGFYIQVLKPGSVSRDDSIELIKNDPNEISISEFVEKYYTDRKNKEFFESLVKNEYVPDEWKQEFNYTD